MARTYIYLFRVLFVVGFFLNVDLLCAQMTMPGVSAMENSVGFWSPRR
jgi:hypothetical protein